MQNICSKKILLNGWYRNELGYTHSLIEHTIELGA